MAFVGAPGELAAEARGAAAAAPQPVGIELLSNPAFDFDNCQRSESRENLPPAALLPGQKGRKRGTNGAHAWRWKRAACCGAHAAGCAPVLAWGQLSGRAAGSSSGAAREVPVAASVPHTPVG